MARHPLQFKTATPADNDRLLQFFADAEIRGPIDLKLRRKNSYFDIYKIMGEESHTFLLEDPKGNIAVVLTLVIRDALIRREKMRVGTIVDLRMTTQKIALRGLSDGLAPLIEEQKRTHRLDAIFCSLSEAQERILHSFIRPRLTRSYLPRFYLVDRFDAVTLHGFLPTLGRSPISIKISAAQKSDLVELSGYLKERAESRFLGWTDLTDRLHALQQLDALASRDRFLIARNYENKIVGCTALIPIQIFQNYRVLRYNGFASTLKTAFNFMSLLGWVDRMPAVNRDFPLVYLAHLEANNSDIFLELMRAANAAKGSNRNLAYTHFQHDPIRMPMSPMITTRMPFMLYTIVPAGDPTPHYLRRSPLEPAPEWDPLLL